MTWRIWCLIALFFVVGLGAWKIVPQAARQWQMGHAEHPFVAPWPNAVPVASQKRLQGDYFAASHEKDDREWSGFGLRDNWPKEGLNATFGLEGSIALVAFPEEPVAYAENRGILLRLINRMDERIAASACDFRLYIVQEALDEAGRWRQIEELPSTSCGNSYHRVFLDPGQYWDFKARSYQGAYKTKLRFRLDLDRVPYGKNSIFSNEFVGQVNIKQMAPLSDPVTDRRAVTSETR